MTYEAHITKVETGETRVYHGEIENPSYESDGAFPDGLLYLWREGNFECDCNREILFERAAGVEIDHDECKCSSGRFRATVIVNRFVAFQD